MSPYTFEKVECYFRAISIRVWLIYMFVSMIPSKMTMILVIITKTKFLIIKGRSTKVMDPYTDFNFFLIDLQYIQYLIAVHRFNISSHFKPFSTTI